jgi:hypothetical protein
MSGDLGAPMPVYLETWAVDFYSDVWAVNGDRIFDNVQSSERRRESVAALAAAAPALVRALLSVEWEGYDRDRSSSCCPECGNEFEWGHVDPTKYPWPKHTSECVVDAALTAAGLDTQEKRVAARAEIAKERR